MFASLVYVISKEKDQNEPEPHKRTLRLFSTKDRAFVHATLAGTGPIAVLILTAHRKGLDLEGEIDRIQNQSNIYFFVFWEGICKKKEKKVNKKLLIAYWTHAEDML